MFLFSAGGAGFIWNWISVRQWSSAAGGGNYWRLSGSSNASESRTWEEVKIRISRSSMSPHLWENEAIWFCHPWLWPGSCLLGSEPDPGAQVASDWLKSGSAGFKELVQFSVLWVLRMFWSDHRRTVLWFWTLASEPKAWWSLWSLCLCSRSDKRNTRSTWRTRGQTVMDLLTALCLQRLTGTTPFSASTGVNEEFGCRVLLPWPGWRCSAAHCGSARTSARTPAFPEQLRGKQSVIIKRWFAAITSVGRNNVTVQILPEQMESMRHDTCHMVLTQHITCQHRKSF